MGSFISHMSRVCGPRRQPPNKGGAGRDNPIVLGLAGQLGGPELNPARFEAGLGGAAWLPAVCCKTMSQPGRGVGEGGGLEGPLPLQPCLWPFPWWVLLTPPSWPLEDSPISFFVVWL